jgi:MYXO-CTERM domain-containing protein
VCNGQVVYVAASAAAAASWYASNLDVSYDPSSLHVTVSGAASCSGDECTASTKAACSASPGPTHGNDAGLLFAGLGFVGIAAVRRRKSR